jgi:hypothetical protein
VYVPYYCVVYVILGYETCSLAGKYTRFDEKSASIFRREEKWR